MTVRALGTRALRMLGIYGSTETPNAADIELALESTKAYLRQCITSGIFGPLTNVTIEADYTAGENERIANLDPDNVTVTLPATMTDAYTGLVRAPYDRSAVVIADDAYFVYDANLGDWTIIEDLTLDSAEPFKAINLSPVLAVYMAADFNLEPSQMVTDRAIVTRAVLRRKQPIRVSVDRALQIGVGHRQWL